MHKYEVQYYRCNSCGFIQTEAPFWLGEAYSNAITRSDIGLVSRNISWSAITRAVVLSFFDPNGKFVDYGGGYGMFARIMRDNGLDYYRMDKYCENLFAQGFDANDQDDEQFELLTAFEVFEHLVDPLVEIEQMLRLSRNILFSTFLVPKSAPGIDQWWYYGPEHGQHVSLYTKEALQRLGEHFGLRLVSNGRFMHLLTTKQISPLQFRFATRNRGAQAINMLLKRRLNKRTLQPDDYFELTGRHLG